MTKFRIHVTEESQLIYEIDLYTDSDEKAQDMFFDIEHEDREEFNSWDKGTHRTVSITKIEKVETNND